MTSWGNFDLPDSRKVHHCSMFFQCFWIMALWFTGIPKLKKRFYNIFRTDRSSFLAQNVFGSRSRWLLAAYPGSAGILYMYSSNHIQYEEELKNFIHLYRTASCYFKNIH